MHNSGAVLQIIDAESYNRLNFLLERKFGALLALSKIMRSGSLPFFPSPGDLRLLVEVGDDQLALSAAWRDLGSRNEELLPMEAEWGEDVYDKVVTYLQEGRPRE